MKDFNQIRIDLNLAVSGVYERYQKVIDDISFAKIPSAQWSESDTQQYANKPKPENNKIARQINRILGQYQKIELNARIIPASQSADMKNAKLLEGLWRNDFSMTEGIEAFQNAADEAFHGGFGALKVIADYEDEENPDINQQCLKIVPIYSAASTVFFNAGALRKDKADAKQCWQLVRTSRIELEELYDRSIASIGEQIDYYDYDYDINRDIYICHYYEIQEVKEMVYDFGFMKLRKRKRTFYDDKNNKMDMDEAKKIIANNQYQTSVRTIKQVEYALIDGFGFLEKARVLPFKQIPIIPQYGYHDVINGIEYFVGEVARQRDNQRFLNMAFSAMMQILAQNQVEKPEYTPEQVDAHKEIFAKMNVEDYPYHLSDPVLNQDGTIAHLGKIGDHKPPELGSGLVGCMQFLESNIQEQGGSGQTSISNNISKETVRQVNDRADDSYQKLFQNAQHAVRQTCRIWLQGAQNIYFSDERTLRVQNEDSSYAQVKTMQYGLDQQNNEISACVNNGEGKYDVIIKTNESFLSVKEAEKQEAMDTLQYTNSETEVGEMALLNIILSSPSVTNESMIKLAKIKQFDIMINNGITPDPDDPQDKQLLEAHMKAKQQQQPQPSPEMIIAQAADKKANTEASGQQIKLMNEQIKAYDAETKRMATILDMQKQGSEIKKLEAEAKAKDLEPLLKHHEMNLKNASGDNNRSQPNVQ